MNAHSDGVLAESWLKGFKNADILIAGRYLLQILKFTTLDIVNLKFT